MLINEFTRDIAQNMSFAGDELDESQITAMDLPLEFKVNKYSIFICDSDDVFMDH